MADEKTKETTATEQEKTFTQTQLDTIIQERLSRERSKFADYEDLRKFKTEHEKQLEQATQKELEAKKEYEKLKEGWGKKEQEFQSLITRKDSEITDMKVSGSLMSEIVKQNAYAEETLALIKSQAVFDKENNIRIKGRDANGLEVMLSVEEGIKKFLEQRPYLVKATKRDGGGTPQGLGGGAGAATDDLNSLNEQFLQAQRSGDYKKMGELKVKMQRGINAQKTKL